MEYISKTEFIKLEKEENDYLIFSDFFDLKNSKKIIIFLNSILDEEKRSQKFQAQLAYSIVKYNYSVFRFDYYGTGDSQGELYEFDFENTISDLHSLILKYSKNYKEIILLGIRIGADLALKYASLYNNIHQLVLIEPVLNGKRFLLEQRTRRKFFYSLNKIRNYSDKILINNKYYEDFLGYPLSDEVITYLNNMDTQYLRITNTKIILLTVNSSNTKKYLNSFQKDMGQCNSLVYKKVNCKPFWISLEPVNTANLIFEIINSINN